MRLKALLAVVAVGLLAATPCLAAPLAPEDVAATFSEFRELNARLDEPVDCECQILQRHEDVARYADGRLSRALDSAVTSICTGDDAEALHALVEITLATAETAADTFSHALASAFICRPERVEGQFEAAGSAQRRTLLDVLSLGFENATAGRHEAADVAKLRARLRSLPSAGD